MINRILLGVVTAAMSSSAFAAIEQAQSIKYLDESGQIVGQRIALCNNWSGAYGNVHTAYHITEVANCIGREQHPASIVPNTHITAYTLPASLTIQQVCTYAQCTDSGQPELDVFFNIAEYGPYNQ